MFDREHLGIGDIEYNCVLDTPTPTATASSTPTVPASPTPSATVEPTATPTARWTPTPARHLVYLPVALGESCARPKVRAEVVLVVDASTTMLRLTSTGRSKIAAAQTAATELLAFMAFSSDDDPAGQLGVVGFNNTAWLQHPLSRDVPSLTRSIDQLAGRVAEGTRLDLALRRGIEVLQRSGRPPDSEQVLILLTDGLPNRVPTAVPGGSQEDSVLAEAGRAHQAGILIYTIGLGRPDSPDPNERISPALLQGVASNPGMYYETPNADDLESIYAQIASAISCPPENYWGRKP